MHKFDVVRSGMPALETFSENERLICLGAGTSQLPVIKAAKDMGHLVIGIDRNSVAPGIKFLDELINVSTYDTNEVINRLKASRARYKFTGLVARTSGPALKTAAAISETFRLPGLISEIVPLATEKSALREFCLQNQFPIAAGIRVRSCKEITSTLEMPVIVKPDLPLVGKKAVRVLFDLSQLEPAINEASRASGNGYTEIQRYIDGFDIACLFWANQGKAEILAYWDELVAITNDNGVIGLGISVPSVVEKTKTQKSVDEIVKELASRFPCVNVLLIMAFRVDMAERPYIVELHADLGGDLIADELFPVSDPRFNYFGLAISIACEKPVNVSHWLPKFKPTSLLYERSMKRTKQQITLTEHHNKQAYIYKSNCLKENLKKTFSLIDDSMLAHLPRHLSWYEMRR